MLTGRKWVYAIAAIALVSGLGACGSSGPGDHAVPAEAASKQFDPQLYEAARRAESQHNYLEAAQHYQSLLARDGENTELALALVRNLRYGGSGQQAAEIVNSLIAREGRTAPLLVELAKAYVAGDQMNLAVPVLEEAAGLAPDQWDIPATLGVALDYQDRYPEAQQAYARALQLSPQNPDVLNNMALSQAQAGDLDGAIATLKQAVDQPSATPQVRQNMALLLAFQGDVEGAERWARKDLPREVADENGKFYRYVAGAY